MPRQRSNAINNPIVPSSLYDSATNHVHVTCVTVMCDLPLMMHLWPLAAGLVPPTMTIIMLAMVLNSGSKQMVIATARVALSDGEWK